MCFGRDRTACRSGVFDVITGLAGAGRYLLGRTQSAPCRRALRDSYWVRWSICPRHDADAVPHWHTTFHHSTENLRNCYPDGHVNLGMAHGIPGPLALLSLSASQGVEVTGQHDAIVRIADRIVKAQCGDEWGVGFPVAASILTVCGEAACGRSEQRANANAAAPARAAWCYGPPGVARALWLAGAASGRSEYCDLAVAAMTAVFERPIPNRRIDSPTLCHGVAGLLQITLRFARDGAGEIFSTAAQELTAQLLDAHEPDEPVRLPRSQAVRPTHRQPRLVGRGRGRRAGLARRRHVRGADLGPDPDAVMTLYDPLDFAVVRAPLMPVDTLDAHRRRRQRPSQHACRARRGPHSPWRA